MSDNFFVIGIGASAGGLEAFESFIANLPVSQHIALILVRHLASEHISISDKLLEKHTTYPIKAIEHGMPVEPGFLYVLIRSHKLEIRDNHFHVTDSKEKKRKLYPIDYFLGSLAESYGPRAIALVLSGAGTDGSFGINAIRERGGRVLVQTPEEAGVNGMPIAALQTGTADIAAPVAELSRWVHQFTQQQIPLKPAPKPVEAPLDEFDSILEHLSEHTELDLSVYKTNTLHRRIRKRMGELGIQEPDRYLAELQKRPEEVRYLKQNLLIGYTDFFRDAEAFQVLVQEVFPYLFRNRGEEEALRVWCAGCSTGEEAYSMAILLQEYIEQHQLKNSFTVFASDVNEDSLRKATEGRYASLPSFLSPEQANRYFFGQDKWFYIRKEVRKRLVFTRQNLLKDPPFIHIDFLSCRNVLIYLKPAAQKKLFMKFHFSLKPGGVLFLGSNESNGTFKKYFKPLNNKWKIYTNIEKQARFSHISTYLDYASPSTSVVSMKRKNQADTPSHTTDYFEKVIREHQPPSLILNAEQEVVYTQGNPDAFIRFRSKRPSLQVLSLLDAGLQVVFRSGLRKLEKGAEEVLFTDVTYARDLEQGTVSILFRKVKAEEHELGLVLVQFFSHPPQATIPMAKPAGGSSPEAAAGSSTELDELERELAFARLELQQTSEELELTNEKLQTANEELLSANEELQSMNEELQSANEELSTLNSELNESLQILRETHSDLGNLINAAEIGVIFLDESLRIRKFTPLTKELFNIQEADTGRYLRDFTNNFNYTAFEQDAHKVLEKLVPLEKEVLDLHSGNTYLMRILPYRTQENKVGGVVLLLVDINSLKKVQDQMLRLNDELKTKATELERAESSWRSLMTHLPDVIGRYDKNLRLLYISDAFFRDTGLSHEQFIGKTAEDIATEAIQDKNWIENMRKVLRTGEKITYTTSFEGGHGQQHYHIVLAPEFDKWGENVENVLVISRNITELIQYERQLQEKIEELEYKERELTRMNQYLDNFVYTAAHDLRSPVANLKLLLSLYAKTTDKERVKLELDKSVSKLDHTLIGLVEVIEAQHSSNSVAKVLQVEEVWERIASDFTDVIREAGAQILLDFSAKPQLVYVEAFLESIFRNMLSNALKYRDAERSLRLAISTDVVEDGRVLLKIKDNGRGMDLKKRGKDLFKPFSRLTQEGEGKGIGLHLVKNMVEKNGGRIELDSESGFGTTFYCYLQEYTH
jgi:two-component system CheB/CheR fusion protein